MASNRSENPVVLSRIYTRTGDDGTTALGDGSRTAKTDPRLAAYADVDEANSAIGMAITFGELPAEIVALLTRVQNEMFDVGADLATPVVESPPYPPLRIDSAYVLHNPIHNAVICVDTLVVTFQPLPTLVSRDS